MKKNNLLAGALIGVAVLGLVVAFYWVRAGGEALGSRVLGVDYLYFFEPALHAKNPYAVAGFYNPFWIFAPLWVVEFFGEYKMPVWLVLNLCGFVYTFVKLKLPLWSILPFLIFSGAFMAMYVGNVEGLVALGLVVPAPLGIVLLMMKPQIGMAVTAYYVLEALIYSGWRKAALILVPVLVLFAVSFGVYGAWFLKSVEVIRGGYNTIFYFPVGVPMGIALIVAGVARRNVGYALMAIPFTTPYMIFHTWAFPFLGAALVLVSEIGNLRWHMQAAKVARRLPVREVK